MRRLHNKKLYDLYSSPEIIRVIKQKLRRWAKHVARLGDRSVSYRILVRRPMAIRSLGRPQTRWENDVKNDFEYHENK
jgi:hypothetical protein